MTLETFTASVARRMEPPDLPPALRALWLDGGGDWTAAHELAGEIETPEGARIHAYLHRKEGDADNAVTGTERPAARRSRGASPTTGPPSPAIFSDASPEPLDSGRAQRRALALCRPFLRLRVPRRDPIV